MEFYDEEGDVPPEIWEKTNPDQWSPKELRRNVGKRPAKPINLIRNLFWEKYDKLLVEELIREVDGGS